MSGTTNGASSIQTQVSNILGRIDALLNSAQGGQTGPSLTEQLQTLATQVGTMQGQFAQLQNSVAALQSQMGSSPPGADSTAVTNQAGGGGGRNTEYTG